nr:hypothetical protein CFP56_57979 [Quercus suber]
MVVLLPVLLCAIATNTDIEGVASTVKACNTGEIQSNLARCAALAPHTPRFHDVVQCEDFPEIQQTVRGCGPNNGKSWGLPNCSRIA